MKQITTDVDLDVAYRDEIIRKLETVSARINRKNDEYEKHPSGIYFQNIPRDPVTNIATIDHKQADKVGYFKVDFLNVTLYQDIKDDDHLTRLMNKEPPWGKFLDEEITDKLFHLHGYHPLLKQYKPKTVEDLAMILAIIRPAKSYLRGKSWETIRNEVWDTSLNRGTYEFKRCHSIAYALTVIANMNLYIEMLNQEKSGLEQARDAIKKATGV
jgi:DNA polymerase III alpha subunit